MLAGGAFLTKVAAFPLHLTAPLCCCCENAAGVLAGVCDLVLPGSSAVLPKAVVWPLAVGFIGMAIRWARRAGRRPASPITLYRLSNRQSILEPLIEPPDRSTAGTFQYWMLSPTDYREELLDGERVWLRQGVEQRLGQREVFRAGGVRIYELAPE